MIPTSRNMARSLTVLVLLTSFVAGQRPFFAGLRPIGFPETPNRTTTTQDPLGNRFGEGTTERLPIEANGDRDLIDRLSKLPIDKQPFWFINWQALEDHRKKPQTYPQRPNVFVDSVPLTSNTQPSGFSSNSGFSSTSGSNSFNQNPGNNFALNNNPSNFQFSAPVASSSFNQVTGNTNNFDGVPNRVSEAQFGLNPTIGNNPGFIPNNDNSYTFVSNTMDINGQSFNTASNDGHSYSTPNSGPSSTRPNSGISNAGTSPTFNSNIGPSPASNSNVGPILTTNAQPSPLSSIIRPNSGSTSNIGPNPNFSSNIPSASSNIGPNSVVSSNIGPSPVVNSRLPSTGISSNIGPNSGLGTNTNFSAANLYPPNANPAALLLNKLPPNASFGNVSFNSFANSFNNSYQHNQNGFFVQSYKTDSFVSHSSSFGSSTRYPV